MRSIPEILDPDSVAKTGAMGSLLDELLDVAAEHASIVVFLEEEALHVTVDGMPSDVLGPRLQTYFRMILAGLGARVADLSHQEFDPYQSESEIQWRGTHLFVGIDNRLQKMGFRTRKKSANDAIEPCS